MVCQARSDQRFAAHATVVADAPLDADAYRTRVADLPALTHVSIEVNRCRGHALAPERSRPAPLSPGS